MQLRARAPTRYALVGAYLAALGCAHQPEVPPPPYKPVTTVLELMESVIAHAAESYWGSVQVIVDETGVHERVPQTDEEWESVWAAALSIAESGNLLMMAPRAVDDGAWMQFARSLVDAGAAAAAAAEAHDVEGVFAAGEQVYNVCTACHTRYLER
ncbi:MAG TPA: hypothetical protein VGL98_07630 [Gammaproteobacteria bacterium]